MKLHPATLLKITVPVVALAVLAGVARAWPVEVEGHRVSGGTVTQEVLGIGMLESARAVPISFEASGRVTRLAVDEGDVVTEGALLGEVDMTRALHELEVSSASVGAAAGDVARAAADLERGQVAAALAARDRARADTLFASAGITAAAHDAAVERDDGARAAVRALEANVRRVASGRAVATGGQRIREAQVSDGHLVSPLAGLVVSRAVEVGQWVAAGTPAFTVASTDAYEVQAWVDETALGRLTVGQPVRLVFRSHAERSFPGQVLRIGHEVDRQTHELLVDIAVLEAPANAAIGQRADAWIEVAQHEAVASVPRGWCDTTCLVAQDGRAVTRPVTLGLVGRDVVEVVSGLSAGDVVLRPDTVTDGRRVRVTETP